MAFEEALRSVTLEADASIGIYTGVPGMPGSLSPNSAKQFRYVKVVSSKTVGLAVGAANEIAIGILQNKPQNVGDAATVGFSGISFAEAGGTVAAGVGVKVDSTGRPVTWVAGTDDPDLRVGVSILAGAVGQLISVLLLIK